MRNMASSWMLKSREPEFQEMAEYTKTFREKMLALEAISDKIAKDRFGEYAVMLAREFYKRCVKSLVDLLTYT